MFTPDKIKERIRLASAIIPYAELITRIYFYGAGCGLSANQELVSIALQNFYDNAKIEVQSDLVAAVRATAKEPSIVCILGTGSNSCYFDGKKIHFGFDSLGYSVMDEASGNYFGRQLLRDFFYKRMPTNLSNRFATEFNLTTEQVLLRLYKSPMPAKYLRSEEHTSELQSRGHLVCRLLLEKKNPQTRTSIDTEQLIWAGACSSSSLMTAQSRDSALGERWPATGVCMTFELVFA